MAYDEGLAERVREFLLQTVPVTEKKMFGGLCFLVGGNMCCGILGEDLIARVPKQEYEALLQRPGAREMDFTGKAMKGMIVVSQESVAEDAALFLWLQDSLDLVLTLPPK